MVAPGLRLLPRFAAICNLDHRILPHLLLVFATLDVDPHEGGTGGTGNAVHANGQRLDRSVRKQITGVLNRRKSGRFAAMTTCDGSLDPSVSEPACVIASSRESVSIPASTRL